MSFEDTTGTNTPTGDQGATPPAAGNPDTVSPVSTEGNDKLVDLLQKRVDDKEVFVEQMKIENADMRRQLKDMEERLTKAGKVEDLIESVRSKEAAGTVTPVEIPTTHDMTNAVLAELQRKANMDSVEAAMSTNYGADYANTVRIKATEMGITVEQLDEMCYSSPLAAIKLFGGDKPQNVIPSTGTATSHSVDLLDNSNGADHAFFNNLRRTNPKEYWKPENQKAYRQLILKDK